MGCERGLASGSGNLLHPASLSVPPPFPLWDEGAVGGYPSTSAQPPGPLQDASTQLSRTGTLSRKSIKAPATPASATLG